MLYNAIRKINLKNKKGNKYGIKPKSTRKYNYDSSTNSISSSCNNSNGFILYNRNL